MPRAKSTTCSIPGCEGRHSARGWCHKHYQRWRTHGDPIGDAEFRRAPRMTRAQLADWALAQCVESEGPLSTPCLLWTRSNSHGYGHVGYGDSTIKLHRLVYEERVGPLGGLWCRHRCDTPACINPDHLEAGTRLENVHDMIDRERKPVYRGNDNPRSKLSEEEVREIVKLGADGLTQRQIAAKFSVSPPHICRILRGRAWTHVTGLLPSA